MGPSTAEMSLDNVSRVVIKKRALGTDLQRLIIEAQFTDVNGKVIQSHDIYIYSVHGHPLVVEMENDNV
jgi:hypothetical protein